MSRASIFVYGSMLNIHSARQVFPSLRISDYIFDVLEGYELSFDNPHEVIVDHQSMQCDFLNIRPSDSYSMVAGCVIDVPESCLDRYLEREQQYRLKKIKLASGKTALTVCCDADRIPSGRVLNGYVMKCLMGVHELLLSGNREQKEFLSIMVGEQIMSATLNKKLVFGDYRFSDQAINSLTNV
ncbi:MAG: hypothetical protein D6732_24270 [Methanobacteriota archaeon]|nr:MAG: hypothetical protein D6732_24270 [Euryarchaeota archaeon]